MKMSSVLSILVSILYSPFTITYRLILGFLFSVILILTFPIFIYRFIITKLARLFRRDLGQILSAQSSLFATPRIDAEPEFNVSIQLRMRGKLDFQKILGVINSRCIVSKGKNGQREYPQFQQYYTQWLGYPFWKNEDQFDIYEHMRTVKLGSEAEINSFIKETLETPFQKFKSPWEFVFIETTENPEWYTLVFKFHHSLGDGKSLYTAFTKASDTPVQSLKSKRVQISFCTSIMRNCNLFLSYFRVLHKMLRQAFSDDGSWDVTRLAGNRLATVSDPIPLNQIKLLSQKFKASVSATLIALVAGAIRRKMLHDKTQIPNGGMGCMVPISVPHHPKGLTNKVLFMDVKLPIHISEVSERVNTVERRIKREKSTRSSAISYLFAVFVGSFPKFFPIGTPKLSAVAMSVFPGPTAPFSIGGNVVEDMTYSINGNRIHSLLVNLMSYNGQFRFAVSSDSTICNSQKDMDDFIYYLHDELHECERTHISFKGDPITIV